MKRWVGLGAIADTLINLGQVLATRPEPGWKTTLHSKLSSSVPLTRSTRQGFCFLSGRTRSASPSQSRKIAKRQKPNSEAEGN